jgi:CRP-like cAMP-binding protein
MQSSMLTAGMFALGWIIVFAVKKPFGILVGVALVQAISGIAAIVYAAKWRRRTGQGGVGSIVTGALFGLAGVIGVPLFLLLWAVQSSGGGFGFGAWGRPLRVRGKVVHPRIRAGSEWAVGETPDVTVLDAHTRKTLAAWWLRDAQKEHASVPAFARLAWQLTALGAPADLLERAYVAGLQEIDHARRCFALVSAYRGSPCGVMPIQAICRKRAGPFPPAPQAPKRLFAVLLQCSTGGLPMDDTGERKDFLMKTPFFGGLDDQQLDLVISCLVEKKFPATASIFSEGEQGRAMYIVHAGELLKYQSSQSGQMVKLMRFKPGDFFGETTLIEMQPRQFTVVAETESRLYELTSANLYQIYKKDINAYVMVLQNINRELCRRLRKADDRITEFADEFKKSGTMITQGVGKIRRLILPDK